MKKTSAKQAKKIEKRILAVVADLKKAKKARKIEHIEMAEKFLANLTAKLDVAAADLKAKKEKLMKARLKKLKLKRPLPSNLHLKRIRKPLNRTRYQRFCVSRGSKN